MIMIVATICISESKRCLYKSIEKDERTAKIQDIVIIDWCLVELPHIKSIHFLDLLKCKLFYYFIVYLFGFMIIYPPSISSPVPFLLGFSMASAQV